MTGTTQTLVVHGDTTVPVQDEGEGTPLVLLPGGSLDISYLEPLAAALVSGGLRVVRVGARRGAEGDESLTMHDLAGDVAAVIEQLDLPRAWVGGHAFGNRVARAVAKDHPERVAGVVLLAAGGRVQPSDEAQHALRIAFSDVSREEAVEAMQYFVGDPDDAESAWDAVQRASQPSLGAMQRAAVQNTPLDEWSTLVPGMPVLIVQGDNDQIAPSENGQELKDSAPDQVTLVEVGDAGHLFPFLQPRETAEAVLGFLRDEDSRAR